jgi:hypothetical protein
MTPSRFDTLFSRHAKAWEETYLTVTPLLPHALPPGRPALESLIARHQELNLNAAPGRLLETSIGPEQARRMFEKLLTYSGKELFPEAFADLAVLAEALFADFEKPYVLANSPSVTWSPFTSVTADSQDMFLAAMDKNRYRLLLGVLGD